MRYKLILEYDGRFFSGWQRQKNVPSVQQTIEEALQKLYPEELMALFVAGRTDAGVHARGQVAHVDLPDKHSASTLKRALNFHLQRTGVSVLSIDNVPFDFHARFSAIRRTYFYRIINRAPPLSLEAGYAWHVPRALNLEGMQEAAKILIGKHDFSSFRAAGCQASSPVKTLETLDIVAYDEAIHFHVSAPSFLYHQVRNIVGTLCQVGSEPEKMIDILRACNRSIAGPTAPAHGLYLMKVDYASSNRLDVDHGGHFGGHVNRHLYP